MPDPRIAPVDPPFAPELQAEFDKIMRGAPPLLLFRTVARNPRVLQRWFAGSLLDKGSVSLRERELTILRTTALCGAEYEWGVHVASFGAKAQWTDEQLRSTAHGHPSDPCWDEREHCVLLLADQLHASGTVTDEAWRRIAASFSGEQLIELVTLAGLYHMVSFMVNAFGVQHEPFAPRFPDPARTGPQVERASHEPSGGPEVRVRPADAQDAHCLSALATQVFLDTYATSGITLALSREAQAQFSVPAFSERLLLPRSRTLLAERRDHLIGFAEVTFDQTHALVPAGPAAELARLYVQSPFLGQGIGRLLLRHAETLAREEGASTLWLTAWIGNERALAFYAGQGYEELGSTQYRFEGQAFENRLFAKPLAP